jgi:hypothetical protein
MVLIGFKPPVSRRAHLTEYGTSKHGARPFMRPAMDAKAGEALTVMAETMASGILREEWKQALSFMAEEDEEIDFGGE